MLVLVSFVLVLAAAVTLVVGLLQSGLTLIYLSIGCSVLAGIVLAVAVLRGRPEPKAAAPVGRPYTPPVSAPPVPASVGAPTTEAATTSFTPPPSPPPPPPTPTPTPQARDDAATKAAGTALLGRLRGRRDDAPVADAPPADAGYAPVEEREPVTASMPMAGAGAEDEDGFPIANYDQLRATDLLRQLGSLDRNQLEAVRERETAGKNRFTILSRVDTLLEAQAEPAWDVAEDDWETEVVASTTVIEVGPADELADDEFADEEFAAGEIEDDEAEEVDDFAAADIDVEEVDELVSPAHDFPIAGYDSLTVGQILPRLSELNADQLAEVRTREQQGRRRGTILDRIDRLASKSAPRVTPAATAPVRKAAPRKARASKAVPVPPATSTTPMKEAVKKAGAKKASTRATPARKVAPIPVPEAPAKKSTRKKAAPPVAADTPAPRKSGSRKAAAPVVPEETTETPMKAAVKKARAAKTTKRP